MARLEGRTALITGAGSGIGAAIARQFRAEGALVLANDIDGDALAGLAGEIDVRTAVADVSDPDAVEEMFARARSELGRLDVLVNNAGYGLESDPDAHHEFTMTALRQASEQAAGKTVATHWNTTATLTNDAWHRMIAVHLHGTFYCCREAIRMMSEQESGCIINMSSVLGTAGAAGVPHYCAAKAGVLGLTRSLARELASRNIRVNAVAPGWIDTKMTESLGALRRALETQTPLGRMGEPDDVAHMAVYLASDEAKFITGQTLSPNGGWHMSQ